jgi:hypothetical protein
VEHVECILWPYGNLVGVWFIFSPFWYIVSRKIWQPGSIIRISKFLDSDEISWFHFRIDERHVQERGHHVRRGHFHVGRSSRLQVCQAEVAFG